MNENAPQHPIALAPSALRELGLFFGKAAVVALALVVCGTQVYRLALGPLYSNADVCNVEVVPILGLVSAYDVIDSGSPDGASSVTTPASVASEIARIAADTTILGVIAYIDVPGGTPAASERMMHVLASSPKPVIAQGGDMMTSGGYMAALGASAIIASPFTDVGSIGVTYSYLDTAKQHEEDGLTWNSLTSSPYKDYGDPNKPLTTEERALILRDASIYHEAFVKLVAERRNKTLEEVRLLADGSSMPASLALERGLIDGIGDEAEALAALATELSVDAEELVICR